MRYTSAPFFLALLASVACGEPAAPPEEPGAPAQLSQVSGDEQQDTVLATLHPIRGTIIDERGLPVSGAVVSWHGEGTVFAHATQSSAAGVVENIWTLSEDIGEHTMQVRWINPETGEAAVLGEFRAVALAGAPATLIVEGGAERTALLGGEVFVSVRAWDRHGHPAPGAEVTWQVDGGGSVEGDAVTDSEGVASAQWSLSGRYEGQALRAALIGGATDTVTARPYLPGDMVVTMAGDHQALSVGQPSGPISLTFTLGDGRPIIGFPHVGWIGMNVNFSVGPSRSGPWIDEILFVATDEDGASIGYVLPNRAIVDSRGEVRWFDPVAGVSGRDVFTYSAVEP